MYKQWKWAWNNSLETTCLFYFFQKHVDLLLSLENNLLHFQENRFIKVFMSITLCSLSTVSTGSVYEVYSLTYGGRPSASNVDGSRLCSLPYISQEHCVLLRGLELVWILSSKVCLLPNSAIQRKCQEAQEATCLFLFFSTLNGFPHKNLNWFSVELSICVHPSLFTYFPSLWCSLD